MSLEIEAIVEPFHAVRTEVALHRAVTLQMSLEKSLKTESFAANVATEPENKRFLEI